MRFLKGLFVGLALAAGLSFAAVTTAPHITGAGINLTTGLIAGILGPANGGTGVANNAAATFTRSGSHALTLTTSNTTALTLPTSGTVLSDAAAVTVAQGGTGRQTSTTAYGLIAGGTTATGAHQTLAAGATTEVLVGGGASALPVWTTAQGSGAPVRATSPTLTTPNIGAATGTSLSTTGLHAVTGTGAGYKSQMTTGVLADNATFDATPPGQSGLMIVRDTNTGDWALFGFSIDIAATTLISQSAGNVFTITVGTDNKTNIYQTGNIIRIQQMNTTGRAILYNFITVSSN